MTFPPIKMHLGIAYRPDIDGLRALAVVPVLLFHAGLTVFSGGFVGVDVFFVISGFLITGIIYRDLESGTFSILRFYERRIRRIIPALLAMIAIVSVLAVILLLPYDLRSYARSALGALLSASNITFLREVGYFQTDAELKPLLHTWSLGVEEQFYLLFPPMMMATHRWCRRATLPLIYLSLALSLGACVIMTQYFPSHAFYLSPLRAWELMMGAVLAVGGVPVIGSPAIREALSLAGLAMLAAAILLFTSTTLFPGIAAALPCLGAALLIYAGEGTRVGGLLSTRPLVFIGLISYSLYLWHWPLLAFGRYLMIRPLSAIEALALLALSFVLATASWRFVELPFRNKATLPTRSKLFGTAIATTSLLATAAALMFVTNGLPSRIPAATFAVAEARIDMTPYRDRCLNLPVSALEAGHPCLIGAHAPPTVLLWGDSHADAISPALSEAARARGTGVIDTSHVSCPPALGVEVYEGGTGRACRAWNDAVRALAASPRIGTVFLVARWAAYAHGRGYGPDGSKTVVLGRDNRKAMLQGLEATLRSLSGKRVLLVLSVPEIRYDVPSSLARKKLFGSQLELRPTRIEYDQRQAIIDADIRRLAKDHRAQIIDPAEILCPGQKCAIESDGTPLYYDNHHLSTRGARELEPLFAKALGSVM